MKNFKGYFNVYYIDDNKRTHFTVVYSWTDVQFLIDRFIQVNYNFVPVDVL